MTHEKQLSFLPVNDKATMAIDLIKYFEPVAIERNSIGYVVGYSGGKDSDVLLDIFVKSGVRFKAIHNHTTLDAPETVYHIRKKFYDLELQGIPCEIHKPNMSFWRLCKNKLMLPSRISRFCCAELKEREIEEYKYAVHSFGVRKSESLKRAKYRDSIETGNNKDYSDKQRFNFDDAETVRQTRMCYTNNYFIVNPIAYWTDGEVWDYLHEAKICTNPLYVYGACRIGCVGCPMSCNRMFEFERYPTYKKMYLNTCDYIIAKRNAEGRNNKYGFKTGAEYFDFWLSDVKTTKQEEGQLSIKDYGFEF